MARASDIRRKVNTDDRIKRVAATTILLDTLDAFVLKKDGDKTILITYIHLFKETFTAGSIIDLAQPLGDWLVHLPKGVCSEKK